mmetsp:Transcript_47826/g.86217  ORF Transcript_47826/g.86217 Transcript_47826/m.86217 type:complete len:202 (-) Transcript_47826:49-654(-)
MLSIKLHGFSLCGILIAHRGGHWMLREAKHTATTTNRLHGGTRISCRITADHSLKINQHPRVLNQHGEGRLHGQLELGLSLGSHEGVVPCLQIFATTICVDEVVEPQVHHCFAANQNWHEVLVIELFPHLLRVNGSIEKYVCRFKAQRKPAHESHGVHKPVCGLIILPKPRISKPGRSCEAASLAQGQAPWQTPRQARHGS